MKKVLHYKKTRIAHAPDILVQCINKYSEKYSAYLYAETGEAMKDSNIFSGTQYLSQYDVIHFHNRYVPCNTPKLIQYHSAATPNNAPPWSDLSFDGQKCVISQYHATLPYYQNIPIVRNIIDLYSSEYKPIYNNNKIRIGYSPSVTHDCTGSPEDKGYSKTVAVLNRLKDELGVDVDIIVKTDLSTCIQRKNRCNIIIDECVTPSYHRSSLEGLALGKMTICSISNEVQEIAKKSCGSYLPVENIWIDYLYNELNRIIQSMGEKKIIEQGRRNRKWMERFWNPVTIVSEYEKLYDGIND